MLGLFQLSLSTCLPFFCRTEIDIARPSHPEPFECVITPRSERAKRMVNQVYYNTYQATHAESTKTDPSKEG